MVRGCKTADLENTQNVVAVDVVRMALVADDHIRLVEVDAEVDQDKYEFAEYDETMMAGDQDIEPVPDVFDVDEVETRNFEVVVGEMG